MTAAALLLSLLSSAPAIVAESFPDDDTNAWTLESAVYTETYEDARTALMFEVTATTTDGVQYLVSIWPNVQGKLTACQGATRKVGDRRWTMLFTDDTCAVGESYPWMR